jgi:hypothetical protein
MRPTIRPHYVALITLAIGVAAGLAIKQVTGSASAGLVTGLLIAALHLALIVFLDGREKLKEMRQTEEV